MEYKCKCGSSYFFIEKQGNNTGLYCSMCGKWQKWINKDEIRLFEHNHNPKESNNGWIHITERKPENNTVVLITYLFKGELTVGSFRYVNGCFEEVYYSEWEVPFFDVIAWMPLPEPYTKEGSNHEC